MGILRGPSLHNMLIAQLCVGIKDDMNDVNNHQWGFKCSSTFVHKQLSGPKLAQVNWLRAYNEQLIHIWWQLARYKSHCMQDGGTLSNPRTKYFFTLTQMHVRLLTSWKWMKYWWSIDWWFDVYNMFEKQAHLECYRHIARDRNYMKKLWSEIAGKLDISRT